MRNRAFAWQGIALGAALALMAAGSLRADDTDLFSSFTRPPNVLVVLDSGGTTTLNPNSDQHLLACGDDPASKLFQEKDTLKWFFDEFPDFNYGFSYNLKNGDIRVRYLNYIYTVTGTSGSLGRPFLQIGDQVRMGDQYNTWTSDTAPVIPIRYGGNGTQVFFAPGSVSTAANPIKVNDRGVKSYIISQTTGNQKTSPLDPPYYYPAVNWGTLAQPIKDGLLGPEYGGKTWAQVANQLHNEGNSTVLTSGTPGWEKALRDYVVPLIQAAQYADSMTRTITIREIAQIADAVDKKTGAVTWRDDPSGEAQTTTLTYTNRFLLYDRSSFGDAATDSADLKGTITALKWQSWGSCCEDGFMEAADTSPSDRVPIVPVPPVPRPPLDASCNAPDQREWIKSFLGPQGTPVFYFPGLGSPAEPGQIGVYLPINRADYIPWTDTVMAGARRPLFKILEAATQYFGAFHMSTEPCQDCRSNYLIVLTDGIETCSSGVPLCNQARQIAKMVEQSNGDYKLTVFAIAYLPEYDETNQALVDLYNEAKDELDCMTKVTGGSAVIASDPQGLRDAFDKIGNAIRERNAAFASPSVPSVELSTREKGYISTFFTVKDRSTWEGHLRAFVVDATTGTIPVVPDPEHPGLLIPDVLQKLWDAADYLAGLANDHVTANSTDDSTRRLFFGSNATSGVPGLRNPFQSGSGSDAVTANEATLYNRILEPDTPVDATTLTTDERNAALKPVVDFVRGVRTDPVLYRYEYNKDDPAPTGKLGRLGDIFHSVPTLTGRPECFQCWAQLLHDYSGFLTANLWRRKVLFVGADDGALHAFDAGFFECVKIHDTDSACTPRYDDGTGKELWAWVPNAVMPTLEPMSSGIGHKYTVDGSPSTADVFIDPVNNGTPTAADRQWRTVVLFGLRQGGRSVTALDVTQPDTVEDATLDGQLIPDVPQALAGADRLPSCLNGGTGCSGSYPSLLWEFTDNATDSNGNHDLGQTWSQPSVAILKVFPAGSDPDTTTDDRYAAIFGGGFERQGSDLASTWGGDYLYMVDIETGKLLLKLPTGVTNGYAIPGEVGILDANLDGVPERLYWTDTGGSFWRMELTGAAAVDVNGRIGWNRIDDDTYRCGGVVNGSGELTGGWIVKRLFKNTDSTYQPIFHRPVIVQIGTSSGGPIYGVGAGSGDRDDITQKNNSPHRFYFIRDPGGTSGLPLTLANLQEVTLTSTVTTSNLLFSNGTDATYGWYLTLGQWEKVNTPAVTIEGQVIFSTFTPTIGETDQAGNCWRPGAAKTYVLDYRNANPPPGSTVRGTPFADSIMMASEPIVYVGEDGKLHVLQSTDALALSEPIAPVAQRGNLMSWREK